MLPPGRQDQYGGAGEVGPEPVLGHVGQLGQDQPQVGRVVSVLAGPARREYAGHPVQRVDTQAGIVGDSGQAGEFRHGMGLQQRVLLERGPGFGHLGRAGELAETGQLHLDPAAGEDPGQLDELVRVTRGQDQPRPPGRAGAFPFRIIHGADSAWRCIPVSSAQPATASPSSSSSSSRLNGSRSAVPWISTKLPSPVQTTFMSVSAATSSS